MAAVCILAVLTHLRNLDSGPAGDSGQTGRSPHIVTPARILASGWEIGGKIAEMSHSRQTDHRLATVWSGGETGDIPVVNCLGEVTILGMAISSLPTSSG